MENGIFALCVQDLRAKDWTAEVFRLGGVSLLDIAVARMIWEQSLNTQNKKTVSIPEIYELV